MYADFEKARASFESMDDMLWDLIQHYTPGYEEDESISVGCIMFLFLADFPTATMMADIPYIAQEFYRNEYLLILKREQVEIFPSMMTPTLYEDFWKRLLTQMANAAVGERESEYAKKLFVRLYKTYYKKEYQSLKRFSKIGYEDIRALSYSQELCDIDPLIMARILVMISFMHIEIRDEVYAVSAFINDYGYYIMQKTEAKEKKEEQFTDEVYRYAIELSQDRCAPGNLLYKELHTKILEDDVLGSKSKKNRSLLSECADFIRGVLTANGFSDDLIEVSLIDLEVDSIEDAIWHEICEAFAVYKKKKIKTELTPERLVWASAIFLCLDILSRTSNQFDHIFQGLMHPDPQKILDDRGGGRPRFKLELDLQEEKKKEKPATKDIKTQDKISKKENEKSAADVDSEQPYLQSIASLEEETVAQREEIRNLKKELESLRAEKERYEEERTELIRLRDHVYSLTEDASDYKDTGLSQEEMKEFLQKYRVMIIGGHTNWTSKIKRMFPNWSYIEANDSVRVNPSMLDNMDYVYFFTDIMCHKVYGKYIQALRTKKLDYGYIHSINIQNNLCQLYNDLTGKKG